MTVKTEVGATILIAFALIAGVAIVIGEKKVSQSFDAIEYSVEQNKEALEE